MSNTGFNIVVDYATSVALPPVTSNGLCLTNMLPYTALVIDGIAVGINSIILVKDQADPTQNGIYEVVQLYDAGINIPFKLQRVTVQNLNYRAIVLVKYGDINVQTMWCLAISDVLITPGVTALIFSKFIPAGVGSSLPYLWFLWDSNVTNLSDVYLQIRSLAGSDFSSGFGGVTPYQPGTPVHPGYRRRVIVYVQGNKNFDNYSNFTTNYPAQVLPDWGGFCLDNVCFIGIDTPTINITWTDEIVGNGNRVLNIGFINLNLVDNGAGRYFSENLLRWDLTDCTYTINKVGDCYRSGLTNALLSLDNSTITVVPNVGGCYFGVINPGVGGCTSLTVIMKNNSVITTAINGNLVTDTSLSGQSTLFMFADATSTYDVATLAFGKPVVYEFPLGSEPVVSNDYLNKAVINFV